MKNNNHDDLMNRIFGNEFERDYFISEITNEEFKKSIENSLKEKETYLNRIEELKIESMNELIQDIFKIY